MSDEVIVNLVDVVIKCYIYVVSIRLEESKFVQNITLKLFFMMTPQSLYLNIIP